MSKEEGDVKVPEGIVDLEEPKKMTREDWRKKKELEEQRKLGNAPAEVDEEGKYVEQMNITHEQGALNCSFIDIMTVIQKKNDSIIMILFLSYMLQCFP